MAFGKLNKAPDLRLPTTRRTVRGRLLKYVLQNMTAAETRMWKRVFWWWH